MLAFLATPEPLQPLERPYDLIAARLAHEGVPVSAIARALARPSSDVRDCLEYHLEIGGITEMPVSDWPPTARRADRLPAFLQKEPEKIQLLSCQRVLKLTPLEAGFILVLLKRDEADKDTLHYVIETQRNMRRADNPEATDRKMVDVIICKLRRKLAKFNVEIKTIWGRGYFINEEGRQKLEHLLVNGAGAAAEV
jgi:hypothetical protein